MLQEKDLKADCGPSVPSDVSVHSDDVPETVDAVPSVPPSEGEKGGKRGKLSQDKDLRRELELVKKQLEEKQKEAQALQGELQENKDLYLRMAAEYDNFRKRTMKEKEQIYRDAASDTVAKLLPVLDNLERAEQFHGDNADAQKVYEGVVQILKQTKDILEKLGVTEIPCLGQPFDPDVHNAVMHVEDDTCEENIVTEVLLKGYRIGDRVVRHAMVKVAN